MNPTLSPQVFTNAGTSEQPMTLQGTVNKSAILVGLLFFSGTFTWRMGAETMPLMIGGLIVSLIAYFVIWFKKEWSGMLATVYAVGEGLVLGAISAMYEARFHGLVLQAVLLTIAVLLGMLGLYTTGIIKPTEKLMMGIAAATGAIALTYLIGFILRMFGVNLSFLYGNGIMGIGFSFVVVGVAAFNLIMNFAMIEYGVKQGAPKYMEWYASFGLLVTLVWLYLEILRLLSKFASRRN